jgi:hypothetical protein
MTGQGVLFGLIIFGLVIAASSYLNNAKVAEANYLNDKRVEAERTAKVLELISAGTADINFILTTPPIVVSEQEKIVAVLPNTDLLEPRSVRVREGQRYSSSTRIVRGYSTGSGRYTSTTESRDQLKTIDRGTLVITDQRIAFMGALKTISIDVKKIMGVDPHPDGVALHCKDKEKVESFKISDGLKLTYHEDQQEVSVPFIGSFLERIISMTMSGQRPRSAIA